MEVCLTRQPIFDKQHKVYAYELLFRSGAHNFYEQVGAITRGKLALINFTRDIMLSGITTIFPNNLVAFELLRITKLDEKMIAVCQQLKQAGYLVVADVFTLHHNYQLLIELVDIIRIDFLYTPKEKAESIIQKVASNEIKFLAGNVNTMGAFSQAKQMGYSYFQGYFFAKPAVISSREVSANKMNYLRLLSEINQPETDFNKLAKIFKEDVGLSYKLFSYINSAFFGLPTKIKTIKHALALIGEHDVKKWLSLIALSSMGKDKTEELIVSSLTRARFYELIAKKVGLQDQASECFLMGLFSLIDALMDQPISDILAKLPISEEIKSALLGENNTFQEIYQLGLSYEKGDWHEVRKHTVKVRLPESELPNLFIEATESSNQILNPSPSLIE